MNKSKNKKKFNLRSSLFVLLLIAILLITSTYAWFTANTTVTISTLDVHVEAQNGLQISVDGQNWKTVITNDDIINASEIYTSGLNQVPYTLEPVSTIGTMDENGRMEMFYGTVTTADADNEDRTILQGDYQITATKEIETRTTTSNREEAAGRFIAFDIFLKVDATKKLSLTDASGVHQTGTGTDKGLKNAARIALCKLGHGTSNDTAATLQALNDGTSSVSYIWEPNCDAHTQAGVNNAKSVYNIDTTAAASGATQLAYNGVKANISTPLPLASTDANYFQAVTPQYATSTVMTNTELFDLEQGVTKFRVYMWIEGQDVDCENTASGTDLSFDLQFEIPAA